MTDPTLAAPTLGLIFILGLRHGLDPDHVTAIDNMVFRAIDDRPRIAPWTGMLFAFGHSLSVAVVAIAAAFLADWLTLPPWMATLMDWLVVLLLLLVGTLNLHALRRDVYRPVGWRTRLMPALLRGDSHPAAIVATGAIFGLVFYTATQAAAWGAAASTVGGIPAAVLISLVFACGIMLTDTADSQIVARLLRTGNSAEHIMRYRRRVGWVIVALSFGMAGYGLLGLSGIGPELPDPVFTGIGVLAAVTVILLLLREKKIFSR
ncbi:HoxN/HupN/NixA family nickel/cobalt transporter [Novosphingobium sp. KACC 22771]|uniref:HoxN/HupN/NixA family nickel/cobalt transporter n=1 Tax=Novosphingobium sp. KACC 22771 TaxID=3025670 RepID=UPI0023663156|nr:nickel permease [Novosphingobium sp. KACC 22771]WDF70910.1 nickel permease [Novosphingobium sp. KACC 22771]